jgi:hypothetical protein
MTEYRTEMYLYSVFTLGVLLHTRPQLGRGFLCRSQERTVLKRRASRFSCSHDQFSHYHRLHFYSYNPSQFSLGPYCHEFMAPLPVTTGSGLDLLTLVSRSLLITTNHSAIASLATPPIARTRSILVLALRYTPLYSSNSHSPSSTTAQRRNSTLLHPLCTGPTENTACTVDKTCLPRRCLAIDPLLFGAFASAGKCLAIRCLAMDVLYYRVSLHALPTNGLLPRI